MEHIRIRGPPGINTQTQIRDYNGLRERLGKCERGIQDMCGHSQGGREMWGRRKKKK